VAGLIERFDQRGVLELDVLAPDAVDSP